MFQQVVWRCWGWWWQWWWWWLVESVKLISCCLKISVSATLNRSDSTLSGRGFINGWHAVQSHCQENPRCPRNWHPVHSTQNSELSLAEIINMTVKFLSPLPHPWTLTISHCFPVETWLIPQVLTCNTWSWFETQSHNKQLLYSDLKILGVITRKGACLGLVLTCKI